MSGMRRGAVGGPAEGLFAAVGGGARGWLRAAGAAREGMVLWEVEITGDADWGGRRRELGMLQLYYLALASDCDDSVNCVSIGITDIMQTTAAAVLQTREPQ